jgi:hypothetical protein
MYSLPKTIHGRVAFRKSALQHIYCIFVRHPIAGSLYMYFVLYSVQKSFLFSFGLFVFCIFDTIAWVAKVTIVELQTGTVKIKGRFQSEHVVYLFCLLQQD